MTENTLQELVKEFDRKLENKDRENFESLANTFEEDDKVDEELEALLKEMNL